MKKIWLVVIVLVVILVTVLLLNRGDRKPSEFKIGVILPQTGYSAFIGESVRKGMDLALDIADKTTTNSEINLIYEDSAGDTKQAVSAYHKLVEVDRVNVVVCVSSGAKALIPLSDRDKKVLFCTAVSGSDIAKGSPWCFRFFINADVDAKMMGEYAVRFTHPRTYATRP